MKESQLSPLLEWSHLALRQEHCELCCLLVLRISILALFPESLCKVKLQAEVNKGLGELYEKSDVLMKDEHIGTQLYELRWALHGRQVMDTYFWKTFSM